MSPFWFVDVLVSPFWLVAVLVCRRFDCTPNFRYILYSISVLFKSDFCMAFCQRLMSLLVTV